MEWDLTPSEARGVGGGVALTHAQNAICPVLQLSSDLILDIFTPGLRLPA